MLKGVKSVECLSKLTAQPYLKEGKYDDLLWGVYVLGQLNIVHAPSVFLVLLDRLKYSSNTCVPWGIFVRPQQLLVLRDSVCLSGLRGGSVCWCDALLRVWKPECSLPSSANLIWGSKHLFGVLFQLKRLCYAPWRCGCLYLVEINSPCIMCVVQTPKPLGSYFCLDLWLSAHGNITRIVYLLNSICC